MNLREALLGAVLLELAVVLELLRHDLEGLGVVPGQLDLLPQVPRRVRPLHGLHEQETLAALLADRRVPAVRQRARLAIAVARDVVLVAAKGLLLPNLCLEAAELLGDDLPYHLIVLHDA